MDRSSLIKKLVSVISKNNTLDLLVFFQWNFRSIDGVEYGGLNSAIGVTKANGPRKTLASI